LALLSFPVQAASTATRSPDQSAIQSYLDRSLDAPGVAFRSAEADVDGDGEKEVIVYVTSPAFCGSGGCVTLMLKRTPRGFRTVMHATITRPPIRLLATRTHGWRDVGVMVAGGGVTAPYEARLRFNGQRYPSNPTVPPARPLAGVAGEILIPKEDR
jgi:hypothetical protein